jgi:hypothetical protein
MTRPISQIGYFVIHHSAADLDVAGLKHEYAMRGEGYNFVIDDETTSQTDRKYDAVELLPPTVISNGVYGLNRSAWNICVDGNYEVQAVAQNSDKVHALIQVIAAKAKAWGWRKHHVAYIITHQHAGLYLSPTRYGTACPGKNLIAHLPYIRQQVARYLPA